MDENTRFFASLDHRLLSQQEQEALFPPPSAKARPHAHLGSNGSSVPIWKRWLRAMIAPFMGFPRLRGDWHQYIEQPDEYDDYELDIDPFGRFPGRPL